MCDPVSLTIGAVAASAATSLYGAAKSASAQRDASSAIAQQDYTTRMAQNQGFLSRIATQSAQTDAQTQVYGDTMAQRLQANQTMREQQQSAQQKQQDILAAENTQAEQLRGQGDTQAQALLDQTNAAKLAAAQTGSQGQAATLLSGAAPPPGPTAADPNAGTDPATQQALTRRLAEASTNIRDYGAKVGKVSSYDEPMQDVSQAITANKTAIMPAQTAETLLRSGSNTRLLPANVAWQNAGDLGAATDQAIVARGQAGLQTAALEAQDKSGLASLQQSDITQNAANISGQRQADDAYQQQVAGIISGIGQLGLYGAGRYGAMPGFLKTA